MSKKRLQSNKQFVVGLSGKMQSGKSWVAKSLGGQFGMVRLSFADALKCDLVGLGLEHDAVMYTKPAAIRSVLQAYGKAWRWQDPDHWIKRVQHAMRMCKSNTVFVVDDVRFENEARWVEEHGVLIRLERPGMLRLLIEDSSETELDYYSFTDTVNGQEGALTKLVEDVEDVLYMRGVLE